MRVENFVFKNLAELLSSVSGFTTADEQVIYSTSVGEFKTLSTSELFDGQISYASGNTDSDNPIQYDTNSIETWSGFGSAGFFTFNKAGYWQLDISTTTTLIAQTEAGSTADDYFNFDFYLNDGLGGYSSISAHSFEGNRIMLVDSVDQKRMIFTVYIPVAGRDGYIQFHDNTGGTAQVKYDGSGLQNKCLWKFLG